jgi:hypothetical protein
MDGRNTGAAAGAMNWSPPDSDFLILPLNLRSHLARFGIGSDDLIVIDGMPEDAALTAGAKKPDGSWSLREVDLDACSFMPLYGNGETYTLRACLLTPDPSDHGLAKTKGKADIKVEVPLTPLPILEDFSDVAIPAPAPGAMADTVIQLPADPNRQGERVPAPPTASPRPTTTSHAPAAPPIPAGSTAAMPAAPELSSPPAAVLAPKPTGPRSTFDQRLAALRAEWQANVARQVAAAQERLKATHLAQLSKIQIQGTPGSEDSRSSGGEASAVAPSVDERLAAARKQWQAEHEAALAEAREKWRSEEGARRAAAEAEWRAEAMQQRIALETKMEETYKERLAAVDAALTAKASAPPPTSPSDQDWAARLERALGDAQVGWEADEAERRAKLEADLKAAYERRIAEIEAQQAALYEMRLAAAEAAWRKAEAERLAAAEAAWSAREAERFAAIEAKWRAEHDKKLEAVLANFGTMMKGQLGAIGGSLLPPEPTVAAAAAPQPRQGEARSPESRASDDDIRWQGTAAA